jgi:uncharacterized protein (TIGR03086 family)
VADEDPIELLSRALDQLAFVLDTIGPDEERFPTPCRSWDVAELADHVVHDLSQYTVAVGGGRPDWRRPAPRVEVDRGPVFRAGSAVLLDAWRAVTDLDAVVNLPIGDLPRSFMLRQHTAEFAVHAWDLVVATAQDVELDAGVARVSLEWARTTLRPEFRGEEGTGKPFGPEVSVAADTPVYPRLVGFFGRDPEFSGGQ